MNASWAGMPVLVVVLWGGFAVNALWCLFENAKNHSFGDYGAGLRQGWPVALAALAGVI